MAKLTKAAQAERDEAITTLRAMLPPGTEVACILRHVSSSGTSRVIDLAIVRDGEIRRIGYLTHKAIGMPYDDKRDGIKVGGCGMDMGFYLVYTLGRTLYPDGAPAVRRRNDTKPGEHERDGGYLLTSRWL